MKFNIKTRINLKEFIPAKLIPRSGSIKNLDIKEKHSTLILNTPQCREVTLPKYIIMDSEDFIAIGLYLAEGTTYCNLNKKIKHSGEIVFVNSNPNCVSIICKLLGKLDINKKNLKWKIGLNINFKANVNKDKLYNYWVTEIGLGRNNSRPNWI